MSKDTTVANIPLANGSKAATGQRALFHLLNNPADTVWEGRILEASPSLKFIRLTRTDTTLFAQEPGGWVSAASVEVVEELPAIELPKKLQCTDPDKPTTAA